MSKTTDEIRSAWITRWRDEAAADDGVWLRNLLGQPDAQTPDLVDGQVRLLELVPVEEPEDGDWDPNFLLHWQTYGADIDEDLVTVWLHGEHHAVLFSEPDSLDLLPFEQILDALQTERVVIENGDDDMETLVDAASFIESALGLSPPSFAMDAETALPWTGDSRRFEVDLTRPEAKRAFSQSII
jgi:hypothetical protein